MNYLKNNLSKLFLWEKIFLLFSIILVVVTLIYAYIKKDQAPYPYYIIIISVTAALFGIIGNLYSTKRLLINYVFGITHVLLYGYIAFYSLYYGDFILNIFFYFPLQIVGLIFWKRHLNDAQEVSTNSLNVKHYLFIVPIFIFSYVGFSLFLSFLNGNHPWLDASSTIFSIFGMFLMIFRFWEQWFIWIIVNIISITMWVVLFLDSDMNTKYAIIFIYMWSAFLLISLIGLKRWWIEFKKNPKEPAEEIKKSAKINDKVYSEQNFKFLVKINQKYLLKIKVYRNLDLI